MCNMFKDHNLVAKFYRSIESQPRGTPKNIYALCSERSVDYKLDNRAFTVLYRSQCVVAVPFVIFFPAQTLSKRRLESLASLRISYQDFTSFNIGNKRQRSSFNFVMFVKSNQSPICSLFDLLLKL